MTYHCSQKATRGLQASFFLVFLFCSLGTPFVFSQPVDSPVTESLASRLIQIVVSIVCAFIAVKVFYYLGLSRLELRIGADELEYGIEPGRIRRIPIADISQVRVINNEHGEPIRITIREIGRKTSIIFLERMDEIREMILSRLHLETTVETVTRSRFEAARTSPWIIGIVLIVSGLLIRIANETISESTSLLIASAALAAVVLGQFLYLWRNRDLSGRSFLAYFLVSAILVVFCVFLAVAR